MMERVCCLIPVVGVKLDISAWMASFINTTQRMNVSRHPTPLLHPLLLPHPGPALKGSC